MTDPKTPAPQTNVRAPIEARDTLLRIGGLLRGDADFLDRLQAFVHEYEGGGRSDLAAQLEALTAPVAALEAGR